MLYFTDASMHGKIQNYIQTLNVRNGLESLSKEVFTGLDVKLGV